MKLNSLVVEAPEATSSVKIRANLWFKINHKPKFNGVQNGKTF
jgi:hypothetical protein